VALLNKCHLMHRELALKEAMDATMALLPAAEKQVGAASDWPRMGKHTSTI